MNASAAQRLAELEDISARQIFFIGGAPRSGTTWLQQILDAHPEICCRGEAFFSQRLVNPLLALFDQWRAMIAMKNERQFAHTGGYPLPDPEDADLLLRVAMLQALRRQCDGVAYRAIGEKTPENVFAFPLYRRLFPHAKFIAIARDPRDVVTSIWHFFRGPSVAADGDDAKFTLIREALPQINLSARAIIALAEQYPTDTMVVTYRGLTEDTSRIVGELFEFLDVGAEPGHIEAAIARASFEAATKGRPRGDGRDGQFLRKGVVGDWRSTLTPAMNDLVLSETAWMFPHFGWSA